MRIRLQDTGSEGPRLRAALLLALVAALLFATVADAFHLHEVHASATQLHMERAGADDGSGQATGAPDCGIHPGCSAALIPDTSTMADVVLIGGREPMTRRDMPSVAEAEPYHPPIIS